MLFLLIDVKAAQQTNRLGDEEIADNILQWSDRLFFQESGWCEWDLGALQDEDSGLCKWILLASGDMVIVQKKNTNLQ